MSHRTIIVVEGCTCGDESFLAFLTPTRHALNGRVYFKKRWPQLYSWKYERATPDWPVVSHVRGDVTAFACLPRRFETVTSTWYDPKFSHCFSKNKNFHLFFLLKHIERCTFWVNTSSFLRLAVDTCGFAPLNFLYRNDRFSTFTLATCTVWYWKRYAPWKVLK